MRFDLTTISYHLCLARTVETDHAVNFSTLPLADLTGLVNRLLELPAKVGRLHRKLSTAWKVATIGVNSLAFGVI